MADSTSDERPTRLWDVRRHKLVAFLDGTIADFEKPVFTRSSVFSPDSALLTTISGQTIWVWNANTGRLIDTLNLKSHGRVWEATFSPSGHVIAVANYDSIARLWRVGSKNALSELQGHTGPVWSATFSPDGQSVLTSSEDSTAKLWDISTGAVTDTFQGTVPLRIAAFSPDSRFFITQGNDSPANIFTASSPGVARLHHNGQVNAGTFSSDGRLIATASFDFAVTVWDSTTRKPLHVFKGLSGFALSLAISRDAHLLAAGCSDSSVRLFDLQTARERPVFSRFDSAVRTVTVSADGRQLMAASMSGIPKIWELGTGRLISEIDQRSSPPELFYEIAFREDGKAIARAGRSGSLQILDVPSGRVRATLAGHSKQIQHMRFSPDGQLLITASEDETARIWNVDSGKMITELRGHAGGVNSADFNADRSMVLTAGADKTVRVWNTATGRAVAHLRDANGEVWAATFSPDGKSILSVSADGFARIYPPEMFASFEELLKLAQGRARRELTQDEVHAFLREEQQR